MNGYMQGAITGGIGQGLQQASSNILNLYGLNKRLEAYKGRNALKVFGHQDAWNPMTLRQFHQPQAPPTSGEQDFRIPRSLTVDPRYGQADANILFDD